MTKLVSFARKSMTRIFSGNSVTDVPNYIRIRSLDAGVRCIASETFSPVGIRVARVRASLTIALVGTRSLSIQFPP